MHQECPQSKLTHEWGLGSDLMMICRQQSHIRTERREQVWLTVPRSVAVSFASVRGRGRVFGTQVALDGAEGVTISAVSRFDIPCQNLACCGCHRCLRGWQRRRRRRSLRTRHTPTKPTHLRALQDQIRALASMTTIDNLACSKSSCSIHQYRVESGRPHVRRNDRFSACTPD